MYVDGNTVRIQIVNASWKLDVNTSYDISV